MRHAHNTRVMDDRGIGTIEAGMRFAQTRAAILADDVANARTPGFVPRDVAQSGDGSFGTVLREVQASGPAHVVEFVMAAEAKNAVTFRALADQEHAMLRELRTVAEDARR